MPVGYVLNKDKTCIIFPTKLLFLFYFVNVIKNISAIYLMFFMYQF